MAISGGGGNRVSGANSEINVTPMADVMLVLLIIFMITTPLIQQGIQINMPSAKNAQEAPEAEAEDATIVTITRSSEYYVNKQLVGEAGFSTKCRKRMPKLLTSPCSCGRMSRLLSVPWSRLWNSLVTPAPSVSVCSSIARGRKGGPRNGYEERARARARCRKSTLRRTSTSSWYS